MHAQPAVLYLKTNVHHPGTFACYRAEMQWSRASIEACADIPAPEQGNSVSSVSSCIPEEACAICSDWDCL